MIVIWSAIDLAKLPQIDAIVFGRSSRSFAKFALPQVKEDVMAKSGKKWSGDVTAHHHPFDLEPGLFANGSAQQIAAALKKSAQDPARHSDDPYRSAISMLDFYVNRAGANLSADQRAKLDQVKSLLKQSFGR
jgi:Protein of unknown function (DUF3175)